MDEQEEVRRVSRMTNSVLSQERPGSKRTVTTEATLMRK
jgi:hypothetical protein